MKQLQYPKISKIMILNRDPLSLRSASIKAESLCKSVVPIIFSTTPRFLLWNACATNTSKIFRDAGETSWTRKAIWSFPFQSCLLPILFNDIQCGYSFISDYSSFKIQHLLLPLISKSLTIRTGRCGVFLFRKSIVERYFGSQRFVGDFFHGILQVNLSTTFICPDPEQQDGTVSRPFAGLWKRLHSRKLTVWKR